MAKTENADAPEGRDAASVAAMGAGAIGLLFTIAAFALFGWKPALSVGAGAAIAVANLVSMAAIIRALLRGDESASASESASDDASASEDEADSASVEAEHVRAGKRGGAAWGVFGILKIVVLFGGIWILLTKGLVDPIPLVVGYGVLPLGIVVSSLSTSLAPRSRRAGRRNRTK